ncbi:MAG TPA: stage II sporulation protein M [Gemmatimonadaceae bacterium]|nr:stage II sporulation protein M [Gemmatimonadaceae bacterium]
MPSAQPASLEQQVDVETPEQVVFSYTIAGIGSRAAAALIDLLICIGAMLLLLLLVSVGAKTLGDGMSIGDQYLVAILIFAQFAMLWLYYVLWEGLADGQTPGKRRLGLRVVQDGGYSVSFAASAVRNIVRVIDMQPGFAYGVGIISAAVSKSGKRIGDIAAGTIVVREQVVTGLVPFATPGAPAGAQAAPANAPLLLTTLLTDDEYSLLERYVARRNAIDPERRARLAEQLATRFRERAPEIGGSDGAMLLQLFERERQARSRGVAARSDTGARREQHAIVAQGSPRWSAFASLLADAQRRGLRHMSEEEVSEFVSRYRELSTDLARLRTASRGRDSDALFSLSRLVAGGHNLFYRQRQLVLAAAWRYMAVTVPRELRRSAGYIAVAAVLLFAPAAISYVAVVRDPSLAADFLPAGMIDRAETGLARERRGETYLPQSEEQMNGPAMASFIMTNNVKVTYVAFAAGMTAGIGTVLALVVNGVQIGGALGLFAANGVAHLILDFVAAHGVLELSAICIAGAGGFLLAAALLVPGARTRSEALVVNGRRALRLVAASTFLLVIAGTIEGYISPRSDWPPEWKYFVSILTALFLVFYVTRARGGSADDEAVEENAYLGRV